MLILTRKVNEAIAIGDDILLVVTDIRGTEARFGLEAPKSVRIMRTELDPEADRWRRAVLDFDLPPGERIWKPKRKPA
jgi:carbon storage regulator